MGDSHAQLKSDSTELFLNSARHLNEHFVVRIVRRFLSNLGAEQVFAYSLVTQPEGGYLLRNAIQMSMQNTISMFGFVFSLFAIRDAAATSRR